VTRVRFVGAALLATFVLAACGGGSSSKPLSKSDYKQQTDQACNGFQKNLITAVAKFDEKKESSVRQTATKTSALLHQVADDLRKVGYPTGLKDEANAFYDGLDKAADSLSNNPDGLKSSTSPKEFKDLESLAKKIGITTCGTAG
jgi:hypothetical protein